MSAIHPRVRIPPSPLGARLLALAAIAAGVSAAGVVSPAPRASAAGHAVGATAGGAGLRATAAGAGLRATVRATAVAAPLPVLGANPGLLFKLGRRPPPGTGVTEVGWPTALGRARDWGFNVTGPGLAARVAPTLGALVDGRARWGLERIYWESWLTGYADRRRPFDWAGLRRVVRARVVAGPAWGALTTAVRRIWPRPG